MYGVYKYEYNGEVIYVGKTQRSFTSRIDCHSQEARFAPYLNEATIFVVGVVDEEGMDDLERYLIAKHKPILNDKMKNYDTVDLGFEIPWEPWIDPRRRNNGRSEDRTKGFSFTLHEKNVDKLKRIARENKVSVSLVLDKILSELP